MPPTAGRPVAKPGDAVATVGRLRIGIEAENRLTDLQSLLRRLSMKQRDGGVDRLVLLVRGTHLNRSIVPRVRVAFARGVPDTGAASSERFGRWSGSRWRCRDLSVSGQALARS